MPSTIIRQVTSHRVASGPSAARRPNPMVATVNPASTMRRYRPNRCTISEDVNAPMTTANVNGMRVVPAAVAETPTTLTIKMDRKKMAAKNDAPTSIEATLTTAKVRLRKRSSEMMGEGTRDSTISRSAVATAAAISRTTTAGDEHGYCCLSSVKASRSGTTEDKQQY